MTLLIAAALTAALNLPVPSGPQPGMTPDAAGQAVSAPPQSPGADIRHGIASTYGPGYAGFLALPEGPGHRVKVCGPARCITRTSNDAGPSLAMQRTGRIVDLDVAGFEAVCGCSWRRGLVKVTVEYLSDGGRPRITPPPTDTQP